MAADRQLAHGAACHRALERGHDDRGRGRAGILVTDRALAQIRRPALAGQHRVVARMPSSAAARAPRRPRQRCLRHSSSEPRRASTAGRARPPWSCRPAAPHPAPPRRPRPLPTLRPAPRGSIVSASPSDLPGAPQRGAPQRPAGTTDGRDQCRSRRHQALARAARCRPPRPAWPGRRRTPGPCSPRDRRRRWRRRAG